MSHVSDRIALSLTGMTGPIHQRLSAMRLHGFSHIELDAVELSREGNLRQAESDVLYSELCPVAFKELKDFTGHAGHVFRYKLEVAKSILDRMSEMQCRLLIVTPSAYNRTDSHDAIVDQLRAIALLAMQRGIKVGFRPLPWSDHASDYESAYQFIKAAGNSNLGLVVDSYHNLTDLSIDALFKTIPAEKVFLVRLSDFAMSTLYSLEDKIEVDHHQRLLPGEGGHSSDLGTLIRNCEQAGFNGHYVLCANDDRYRFASLDQVIKQAALSKAWVLAKVEG
jgi:sugar phosphate isomerase/epimerase